MFPSFNSFDDSSFILSDHKKTSFSKQYDDPPLFKFPSPFLDEHESPLSQIFSQNHQMAAGNPHPSDQQTKHNIGESKLVEKENPSVVPLRRRNLGVVPRRRAGKKDRHSKICTAQGVRDRRMRLSLQVARKFFDLQDMLGYDKASKTIEWLFTKSKKAIKELIDDHHPRANHIFISDAKSESFVVSECEDGSGIDDNNNTSGKDVDDSSTAPATMPLTINPREKDERYTMRQKARERARCRTREKTMARRVEYTGPWCNSNPIDNGLVQKLGFSDSPFECADQESKPSNQESVSIHEADYYSPFEEQLARDVSMMGKFLENSSSSSTSWPVSENCYSSASGFSDFNNNFIGFFGNWDLMNIDRIGSIYAVTNSVSLVGNPNSVYSAVAEFP